MGLIPLNERAREERRLLESLAHLPTQGVRVIIVDEKISPKCDITSTIHLPKFLFEPGNERDLILNWRHELQHARDLLDHVDVANITAETFSELRPVLEKRAKNAERHTGLANDPDWLVDRVI